MTKQFDALVVGSGTAGQTVAHRLKDSGFKTGLVEHRERPGGTCALRGCQAKKWFYEGARAVALSRHLSGIGIDSPARASWLQLRDAKNRFTAKVPSDTVDGLEKAGIDFIRGRARFVGPRDLTVDGRPFSARYIVLATGAVPMPLPIEGAEHMVSSSQFMELPHLPSRIVFIGGGFISFEFAHFAARLGPAGTRCTILEAGSRPLGPFDEEMVDLLVEASRAEEIDVRCDVEITAIGEAQGALTVEAKGGDRFEADLVVHGAGRSANIDDLELDRAGIESTKKGIDVTDRMATTNAHVYAVGDCAATVQLARVADAEARVAAADIADRNRGGSRDSRMDYAAVPSVLFTYPQVGMVGATERELEEKGVRYQKSFGDHLTWSTYRRVGLMSAAYKILAGESGEVLGAHVITDSSTGLINTFKLAMVNRISIETLYRQSVMTPYPSRESDLITMLQPLVS